MRAAKLIALTCKSFRSQGLGRQLPQQSLEVSLLEVPVIGEAGVNSVLPHWRDIGTRYLLQEFPKSTHRYPRRSLLYGYAGPSTNHRQPSAQDLFQPADNLPLVLQLIGVLLPLAHAVAPTLDRIEIATVPFGLEGLAKAGNPGDSIPSQQIQLLALISCGSSTS